MGIPLLLLSRGRRRQRAKIVKAAAFTEPAFRRHAECGRGGFMPQQPEENMVSTILLVVALVLFVISAVGVPSRYNLQSAGLAVWVLSLLVGNFPM
jgi:hypothetical protein